MWLRIIEKSAKALVAMQVLLTNAIGAPLMMMLGSNYSVPPGCSSTFRLGIATGEVSKFRWEMINMSNLPLLVVSCIVGAGIGFSSWFSPQIMPFPDLFFRWCRSLVSATSFTVIGILNKLLTVAQQHCVCVRCS